MEVTLSRTEGLEGRVAVVTGAMGKLGPVWVSALARAGARVACLDLEEAKTPPPLLDLMAQASNQVQTFAADVTDRAALDRACTAIEAALGPVGILVNNAGVDQPPGPARTHELEKIPVADCLRVLEVNLLGLFQATQAFLPSLRRASGTASAANPARTRTASIINIGSLYSTVSPDARFYDHLGMDPPFLKPPMYGASKAGVSSLTRYFAAHLARDGIRVNTLAPGGVLGAQDAEFKRKFCERVPLGRMATFEDLVGPLLFLASEASAYVTGQELLVDGGFTAW